MNDSNASTSFLVQVRATFEYIRELPIGGSRDELGPLCEKVLGMSVQINKLWGDLSPDLSQDLIEYAQLKRDDDGFDRAGWVVWWEEIVDREIQKLENYYELSAKENTR